MGMVLLIVFVVALSIGLAVFLVELAAFAILRKVLSRGQWKVFFILGLLSYGLIALAWPLLIDALNLVQPPKSNYPGFDSLVVNAEAIGLSPAIAGLFGLIALFDTRHKQTDLLK